MKKRIVLPIVICSVLVVGSIAAAISIVKINEANAEAAKNTLAFTKYSGGSPFPDTKYLLVSESDNKAMTFNQGDYGMEGSSITISSNEIKVDINDPNNIVWSATILDEVNMLGTPSETFLYYDDGSTGCLNVGEVYDNSSCWRLVGSNIQNESVLSDSIKYDTDEECFIYGEDGNNVSLYILKDTKCEVTFNMNGHGTSISPMEVEKGDLIDKPTTPTDNGYVFLGWFKEPSFSNKWDFDKDLVKENITLHAKWVDYGISTNSVGGYYVDKGNKIPLVGFGFTITSGSINDLLNQISDNSFGVRVYSDQGKTLVKEFKTATKQSLIDNNGRFYSTYIEGTDNTTYYAKGFFTVEDVEFVTDLISATTNTSGTEYKLS